MNKRRAVSIAVFVMGLLYAGLGILHAHVQHACPNNPGAPGAHCPHNDKDKSKDKYGKFWGGANPPVECICPGECVLWNHMNHTFWSAVFAKVTG